MTKKTFLFWAILAVAAVSLHGCGSDPAWENGVMYDLGVHNDFYDYPFVLPYPFSEAVDINANGKVAGNSITINRHYRGFYLSPVFP